MDIRNMDIINAYTSLDEMMQRGNGPLMLLSPQQMFEMGQFYQWAKPIINDNTVVMDQYTSVPNLFYP